MENTNNTNIVLEKKLDEYGTNFKDFVAPHELTVTITLSEYRDLVGKNATRKSDIDKANEDMYTRNEENRRLKEEKAKLEEEVTSLKLKIHELKDGCNNSGERNED